MLLKAWDILIQEKPKELSIKGFNGEGKPTVNDEHIVFNGDHSLLIRNDPSWGPEYGDHETMTLTKFKYAEDNFGFCKTARKPYDLVVCTLLLLAKKIAPGIFVIGSDVVGPISKAKEWKPAYKLFRNVIKKTIHKISNDFENDIKVPENWREEFIDLVRKGESDDELFSFIRDCYFSLERLSPLLSKNA